MTRHELTEQGLKQQDARRTALLIAGQLYLLLQITLPLYQEANLRRQIGISKFPWFLLLSRYLLIRIKSNTIAYGIEA
jgi:uncharacterized membrane protein